MDETHTAFVEKVKSLAAKRGLSVNYLADFAGISRGHMSRILRGRHSPNLRTMCAIAQALDVQVAQLVSADYDESSGNHRD